MPCNKQKAGSNDVLESIFKDPMPHKGKRKLEQFINLISIVCSLNKWTLNT